MKQHTISYIVPLFNEEARIKHTFVQCKKLLQRTTTREIILIDDGSTDSTYARVIDFQKRTTTKKIQILRHRRNCGKGAAIRTGVKKASGSAIFFMDADFSTPISQIQIALRKLQTHDVVIGVRKHTQAEILVHQPMAREFLGHIFTQLSNYLLDMRIYDVTCGFKLFRKNSAKRIFSNAKIDRWAFDAEILFLAKLYGYRLFQIPVVWCNDARSKVTVLSDGIQSFLDLLRIRYYDNAGVYRRKV